MIGSTHEMTPKLLSVLERPSRGQEVAHDAMLRMPAAWLALDDDDWEWLPDLRHHLVLTDTTDALGGQGMMKPCGLDSPTPSLTRWLPGVDDAALSPGRAGQ